jgi:hypothetical protein
MKEQLIRLAHKIEQVRKNSRLPTYQQSELTEIKYALLKLTNEVKYLIIISKGDDLSKIQFVVKSNSPETELALRGFKQMNTNQNKWFNVSRMLDARIIDANEEWPQI